MVNRLYFQEAVSENVIIFDGLARAGKGLVAPLISDLRRVEFAQLRHPVDHIPVLWRLGLLDDQSAASFLRMTVDGFLYERVVGRHLNTRHDDVFTSVHRSLNKKEILQRAFGDEGQPVVDRFNAEGRFSSFITHNTLPMADLWFNAYPKLRFVVTVRHPVDVCFSWQAGGWGERLGIDPLSFWPVLEIDGKPVPWFAMDFADEYLDLSPMDRCVKCCLVLNRMFDETLETFDDSRRRQVEIVAFERMVTDPETEIEKLAGWLGTAPREDMPIALARERVPRRLDITDRRARLEKIKAQIRPDLLDELLAASRDYETSWEMDAV